jgi:hypothetical protein
MGINTGEAPKPFPYYPAVVSEEEMKRNELMMELNKWANNDPEIAQRAAETLIFLLAKQFNMDVAITTTKVIR